MAKKKKYRLAHPERLLLAIALFLVLVFAVILLVSVIGNTHREGSFTDSMITESVPQESIPEDETGGITSVNDLPEQLRLLLEALSRYTDSRNAQEVTP